MPGQTWEERADTQQNFLAMLEHLAGKSVARSGKTGRAEPKRLRRRLDASLHMIQKHFNREEKPC